jgi:hypothetical protein
VHAFIVHAFMLQPYNSCSSGASEEYIMQLDQDMSENYLPAAQATMPEFVKPGRSAVRKPCRKFTPPASATPLPLHSHTSQPHNTSAPLPTASRASLPSHSRRPPQPQPASKHARPTQPTESTQPSCLLACLGPPQMECCCTT